MPSDTKIKEQVTWAYAVLHKSDIGDNICRLIMDSFLEKVKHAE